MQDEMAVITARGIQYQNQLFTCTRAIAEQWFDVTSPYNMTVIPVSYQNDLLFVISEYGELLSTSRIPPSKKLTQDELIQYFTLLNQLKLEFKTIKKEKS